MAALLAATWNSSMVVLIAGFSPWSGQHIVSALLPCACFVAATLPNGAPGVR
jgi:hypothetical protein